VVQLTDGFVFKKAKTSLSQPTSSSSKDVPSVPTVVSAGAPLPPVAAVTSERKTKAAKSSSKAKTSKAKKVAVVTKPVKPPKLPRVPLPVLTFEQKRTEDTNEEAAGDDHASAPTTIQQLFEQCRAHIDEVYRNDTDHSHVMTALDAVTTSFMDALPSHISDDNNNNNNNDNALMEAKAAKAVAAVTSSHVPKPNPLNIAAQKRLHDLEVAVRGIEKERNTIRNEVKRWKAWGNDVFTQVNSVPYQPSQPPLPTLIPTVTETYIAVSQDVSHIIRFPHSVLFSSSFAFPIE
jgi:hypothetical protein